LTGTARIIRLINLLPQRETEPNSRESAAYGASCDNLLNNFNHDAAASGKRLRNIEQQAGKM